MNQQNGSRLSGRFRPSFCRSPKRPTGWFCQGGGEFIQQSTLACALDRLTLLAAGSKPKVGALFAQAERNRSFCGQRDPILAATPKYHLRWKSIGQPAAASPHRTLSTASAAVVS
jgi:hypothetical protein